MAPSRNTAQSGGVEYVEAGAPQKAEFYSDQHRENYVRALLEEKRGYDNHAAGADENGGTDVNGTTKAAWVNRAAAVQAEIDRVNGDIEAGTKTVRGSKTPVDQVGSDD